MVPTPRQSRLASHAQEYSNDEMKMADRPADLAFDLGFVI
jgi:hypothetical protein